VAARPTIGPVPSTVELGRRITDLNPGLLRSGFEGQANAILVAPGLRTWNHQALVLNAKRFRERLADELGLGLRARMAWARERRIAQAVRVGLPDGRTAVVVNAHMTAWPDRRLADAELLRAATFADGLAEPEEPVVLAGDFNVTVVSSTTLRALSEPEWGFSTAGPGLDHVLVRGLGVVRPEMHWSEDRRRHGEVLLSDHAPVEIEVE
jgi:endonuclease/exonuclease/phosphatase (EEP) superfamily protein YafD